MLIDLSLSLTDNLPVYPGDPEVRLEPVGTVAADGYALSAIRLGSHSGTHIDAPAHMIDGGDTLGRMSLERFVAPGKLVDGISLHAAQEAGLQPGDAAVVYTGRSEQFAANDYYTNYPVMDAAVADYLVACSVSMVLIDTCSADSAAPYPIHQILLSAGIPIVENIANARRLVGRTFRIIALPLAIDADGAPARVVAEVEA
jgi:arylformamidase